MAFNQGQRASYSELVAVITMVLCMLLLVITPARAEQASAEPAIADASVRPEQRANLQPSEHLSQESSERISQQTVPSPAKAQFKLSPTDAATGARPDWQTEQLQKAKHAASAHHEREQQVLKRQAASEWQEAQQQQAQQAFDSRHQREQKYLQQARDAATKARKIPKKSDQ